MKLIYALLLLLPLTTLAQLKKYERVQWHVIPTSGLSNEFSIQMILTRNDGRIDTISPMRKARFWDLFQFETENIIPIEFNKGRGKYDPLDNETFLNEISILAKCKSNPKLNSWFSVPLQYCKKLHLENETISSNGTTDLVWTMEMNTGEFHRFNPIWYNLNQLESKSDSHLRIYNNLKIETLNNTPILYGNVRFVHKTTGELVAEKKLEIVYSNQFFLDYSGRKGNDGQDGYNGKKYGENGGNGENGGDGEDGLDVRLIVGIYEVNGKQFLEIQDELHPDNGTFYIQMNDAQISIQSNGGEGGEGGKGGRGQDAEITGKNTNTKGGAGGNGGNGGDGGRGGNVEILVVNNVDVSKISFSIENNGGKKGYSGNGGKNGDTDTDEKKLFSGPGRASSGYSGDDGKKGQYKGIITITPEEFERRFRR